MCILFKLEDKLVDFLSATAHVALCGIGLHVEFVQLLLQLGDLLIFALDLLFLNIEQTLHVRVLLFEAANSVIFASVLLKKLAKLLVRIDGKLLHLALD